MDWTEAQINNEEVFPVKTGEFASDLADLLSPFPVGWTLFQRAQLHCSTGVTSASSRLPLTRLDPLAPPHRADVPFPKNFISVCKKILTRLFRVFVHVYIHHFDRIVAIGAEAHVNTCYKHFYFFVTEFELVATKEFEPLVSRRPPLDGNLRSRKLRSMK